MLTHLERHSAVTLVLLGVFVVLAGVMAAGIYLNRPQPPPPDDALLVSRSVFRSGAAPLAHKYAKPWDASDKGETGPGRKSSG
ncbi:MAG TPA: hypothetical protein VGK74_24365 [Symbiobacteriaceae bacterium]